MTISEFIPVKDAVIFDRTAERGNRIRGEARDEIVYHVLTNVPPAGDIISRIEWDAGESKLIIYAIRASNGEEYVMAEPVIPVVEGGPGPANSLSIGTVSSGTTPSASITGTAPSQTLNLVVPKGNPGNTGIGIQGASISGSVITFDMTSGPDITVTVPSLSAAIAAATNAQNAADDAADSLSDINAQAIVISGYVTNASDYRDQAQGFANDASGYVSSIQAFRDQAEDFAQDAQESAENAAEIVTTGLPNATSTIKGGIKLTGELGGTWDFPTVPGLLAKQDTISIGTTAQYYRGDKSWQTLNKAAVGLSSVDNTADAAKPVSTATQTALNLKQDTIATGTNAQYYRGDKSWQTLDKSAVGLGSVDNTADTAKPVSTAQQTALNLKQSTSEKNANNGYAGLDSSGLIPSTLLPAYVDDVLEYANLAAFPGTGVTGKIYVTADTNKTYRWAGSSYVEISPSPGSADAVPEGSVNLYYTQSRADARAAAILAARSVIAGTGLSGGGALSADRSFSVVYGSAAGTAAQGNDGRLSDTRIPTDDSVGTAKLQNTAVTLAKLASSVQTSLAKADSARQDSDIITGALPGSGVVGKLYVVP